MARDRRTHYQVLRVARSAERDEIRAAYLRQARRHHPDNAGTDLAAISEAETEMRAVNAAWEVLGDADARRSYDRTLPPISHHPPQGDPDSAPGGSARDSATYGEADADDTPGAPIGGVAKLLVRLAPLAFLAGLAVAMGGLVLQVGSLWRVGLVMLMVSLVAFLLAPFFVMSSAARGRR